MAHSENMTSNRGLAAPRGRAVFVDRKLHLIAVGEIISLYNSASLCWCWWNCASLHLLRETSRCTDLLRRPVSRWWGCRQGSGGEQWGCAAGKRPLEGSFPLFSAAEHSPQPEPALKWKSHALDRSGKTRMKTGLLPPLESPAWNL